MSRYYFHIRDGRFLVRDEEGMDCASLSAVQKEASASFRDLAREARSGALPGIIEVEDEDGRHVLLPATIDQMH